MASYTSIHRCRKVEATSYTQRTGCLSLEIDSDDGVFQLDLYGLPPDEAARIYSDLSEKREGHAA